MMLHLFVKLQAANKAIKAAKDFQKAKHCLFATIFDVKNKFEHKILFVTLQNYSLFPLLHNMTAAIF